MHSLFLSTLRISSLAFAVAGLGLLGASRPAAAQTFTATLSDVQFSDGAVATGSFNFNTTLHTIGAYHITTTNGVTSFFAGAQYIPQPNNSTGYPAEQSNRVFEFQSTGAAGVTPYNFLVLLPDANMTSAGTYLLQPGFFTGGGTLDDSQENSVGGTPLVVDKRAIIAGSLIVTQAVPVPEASTTASLGLLLALGGLVMAVGRKKVKTVLPN